MLIDCPGKCAHWFKDCDETMKKVTEGVNGFLFQELLEASRHTDKSVVELFRLGTQILVSNAYMCVSSRSHMKTFCLSLQARP